MGCCAMQDRKGKNKRKEQQTYQNLHVVPFCHMKKKKKGRGKDRGEMEETKGKGR